MNGLIIPVWILAIVGVIRITQNAYQLMILKRQNKQNKKYMDRATDAFIESLNNTDAEAIFAAIDKSFEYAEKRRKEEQQDEN